MKPFLSTFAELNQPVIINSLDYIINKCHGFVFQLQKDVISDLDSLMQLTGSLLTNPNTEPIILFIDAVNQVRSSHFSYYVPQKWNFHSAVIINSTIHVFVVHSLWGKTGL